jgi:hypothetical protein
VVVHTYNPSYSGGWGRSLKPAWTIQYNPVSKKQNVDQSTCLASVRLWVQTPVLQNKQTQGGECSSVEEYLPSLWIQSPAHKHTHTSRKPKNRLKRCKNRDGETNYDGSNNLAKQECQVWWYTLIIPALGRPRGQRQVQGRPCLKKKKKSWRSQGRPVAGHTPSRSSLASFLLDVWQTVLVFSCVALYSSTQGDFCRFLTQRRIKSLLFLKRSF